MPDVRDDNPADLSVAPFSDEPLTSPVAPPPEEATARGHDTEGLDDTSPRHALFNRMRLVVSAGQDEGASHLANRERLVIGTHPLADFVLNDPTVSRFHCEIWIERGRALIRDLGSRNGTIVDAIVVTQAQLPTHATLVLGRTRVAFSLDADHVKVPLSSHDRFGLMVGRSQTMRSVFHQLERAAKSDASVLIEGETGTGKELAAESIHRESARADGPFVVVDCGALPPNLLESELFGHERGAFTGAVAARRGAFATASGGSIFLDEIGELPTDLQPKLLRALERREIKRVGADRYEGIDVRVIAATNRNLASEVNAKRFRSDLYYRLAVLQVRLPALRERLDDLQLLIGAILDNLGVDPTRPEVAAVRKEEFLSHVRLHPWQGNVRELRNYVERCIAYGGEAPLSQSDTEEAPVASPGLAGVLDAYIDVDKPLRVVRDHVLEELERRYLLALLERHGNNVSAAARASGIHRGNFYRLLWRHGLR
jgi:DNA-binding NtrC family response regulator